MTFEHIFKTIYGYEPFPWQSEVAKRLSEGKRVASIDVPTASGKTALIDASLYAAAHGGPRCIAFIIDRKVVVDEAYDRALKIVAALKTNPSLSDFSKKLGDVQVVRLRGGVHGYDEWVLYPDKVTIIISTVDQVGSRLLHRGYGVSPRMAPVHAGFLGNNAVYIIDEAHLSNPFIETVSSACRYGADIQLITMTATPSSKTEEVITLSSEDRNHPVLKRRINASKKVTLELTSNQEAEFVKRSVVAARELSDSGRIIGVIVNRVNTARKIHKALLKAKQKSELLTGRIRPYDRDLLMTRVFPVIRAGRNRKDGPPLFIVATQTVEVGADIDFDALITEAAPLDALRQRFGRVDRLGELEKTKGRILYRPKLDKKKNAIPDLIYGTRIHDDWLWLINNSIVDCIDFGIKAMEDLLSQNQPTLYEPHKAPLLLPTHIELLAQTGPEAPYLDVTPWLHGTKRPSADVALIWRADLRVNNSDSWIETIMLRPPLSREAMEIPIYAVRAWLEGRQDQEITDLEGTDIHTGDPRRSEKLVLCWRGSDDCQLITSIDIRPGDTIVLPSEYGGCNSHGWDPGDKKAVVDVADYCSFERSKYHIIRLVPGLTKWIGKGEKEILESVKELVVSEAEIDPELGANQERIDKAYVHLRDLVSEVNSPLIQCFKSRYDIEFHPMGIILTGRIMDEANTKLNVGKPVQLDKHLEGVAKIANELASGHPNEDRIVYAAQQHDIGKAEPRFQTMLHGSPIMAASGPLLAKSGMKTRSQIRASYVESELPKGFRHELASLAYLDGKDLLFDSDMLVRFLISTHHGYGRPWFPYCEDSSAPGVELTEMGCERSQYFSTLFKELGAWQLAGMELLVRASDARQSKAEQRKGEKNV